MGHLWDALSLAYDVLGFNRAAGGDEVFRHLVLARIIEPTSKLDSLRVLVLTGNTITHPCGNRAFGRRPGGRRIAVTRKKDQRAGGAGSCGLPDGDGNGQAAWFWAGVAG